mmetsp:Transcript_11897/g.17688  ORF Transcript_11897/g.17688 Transcript_11897/m.17688 type:complete len:198 (+) Transcript_11897:30-623(+)
MSETSETSCVSGVSAHTNRTGFAVPKHTGVVRDDFWLPGIDLDVGLENYRKQQRKRKSYGWLYKLCCCGGICLPREKVYSPRESMVIGQHVVVVTNEKPVFRITLTETNKDSFDVLLKHFKKGSGYVCGVITRMYPGTQNELRIIAKYHGLMLPHYYEGKRVPVHKSFLYPIPFEGRDASQKVSHTHSIVVASTTTT